MPALNILVSRSVVDWFEFQVHDVIQVKNECQMFHLRKYNMQLLLLCGQIKRYNNSITAIMRK